MADTRARDLLTRGIECLRAARTPEPTREARLLLASALDIAPGRVTVALDETAPADAAARYASMIDARAAGQPIAQIRGTRLFWGRSFRVSSDVLDPRPETETLIAAALARGPAASLLDLGTGTGAIAITLLREWPAATGRAVDCSDAALDVARDNACVHGVDTRLRLSRGNWLDGIDGRFERVLCNPPYISAPEMARLDPSVRAWEPHIALSPGPSGLESYAAIAPDLARVLTPDGRAFFEIGPAQARDAAALFAAAGLDLCAVHADMDGRDRVLELAMR